MAHNVIMPKTGMAMEEGTLVQWLKKPGDTVSRGEIIAIIETDKVTMDLEAEYDGTLLSIVRGDGEVVPATQTIAWIGAPGEKIEAVAAESAPAATPLPTAARRETAQEAPGAPSAPGVGRTPASPAARRIAAEAGIALSTVKGSGPYGAVLARDVRAGSAVPAPAAAGPGIPAATPGGIPAATPGGILMSGMRRAIAEKMLRSHQQVPSVTLVTRADVTELAALRARINAVGASKISFTDFIVKAAAVALRENPLVNSVIEGDRIVHRAEINIGVAVALEAGLIVPVIRGADSLSVRQISDQARHLAEKARTGSLSAGEYAGGTFTVTNLGMYGITEFTPLINVPESAILGVGAMEEAFRTGKDGTIESRRIMSLCLTHDHRHIDGAPAALFLSRIRTLLEDSYALLT